MAKLDIVAREIVAAGGAAPAAQGDAPDEKAVEGFCRQLKHEYGTGQKGSDMQKFTSCLWFDDQAEEAANFYVSIFPDSKIGNITRYGPAGAEASGRPEGTVMTVTFQLQGQEFLALNGGPVFTFSPAISLVVNCRTQEEVDNLWEKLSAGGKTQGCGWLQDKYGVSWQIVPTALPEMLQDQDPEKAERVMQAMLQMDKIDIQKLKQAYEQPSAEPASEFSMQGETGRKAKGR